jgi:alkaline phosphatase D
MRTKFLTLLLALVCGLATVQAQYISHGPVFGGVSDTSLKVYIRTQQARTFALEYSQSPNFTTFATVNDSTRADRDNSVIVTLRGLSPRILYFVRFRFAGNILDTLIGQVRTFPLPTTQNTYSAIGFGSCQSTFRYGVPQNRDSIYNTVLRHDLDAFLHLGDWEYPNNDSITQTTTNVYCRNYSGVQTAYRVRYSSPYMPRMLRQIPMGYVWSDCDYVEGNASALSAQYAVVVGTDLVLANPPFAPSARRNVIKGYYENFPAYKAVDTTKGIFHSFRLGSAEFFMLDTRSNRTPDNDAFQKTGPITAPWVFNPPTGHTILGVDQLNWLKTSIKNSRATWKVIVGDVPFNKAQKQLLDLALSVQTLAIPGVGSAGKLASALADAWIGFPADQQSLLDYLSTNNLKNVIYLSGDSHTSAIDDGTNAGIPEFMAANLAIGNSRIVNQVSSFVPPANLWNKGAQGIGNTNYNNAFGKVEFFGEDSLRMTLVDEFNTNVFSYTLRNQYLTAVKPEEDAATNWTLKPNPTSGADAVFLSLNAPINKFQRVDIVDVQGRLIGQTSLAQGNTSVQLPTQELPAGLYFVRLFGDNAFSVKPLLKP